jgi:hypothetical protein
MKNNDSNEVTSSAYGGNLSEVPKPHKRKYKKNDKNRLVRLSVMVYTGVGRHYYCRLSEDDNPIWDINLPGYRTCWDDDKAKGREEYKSFDNVIQVRRWVRHMMSFVFKNHKLEVDFAEDEIKGYFVYPEHD